ncbi:DJ-1/PfpI family protein [Nakamurella leprariae]|uniref:DJ-1/PfpI family protein n=1 Tax=Nakamurella leprariae TaxID=2803911 RepID=A0A938Y7Y5_9ACTN|nr:DJ-1/PfpI family protein [Nakamurella leprariae]MBM9467490.1 DJ-1/PfpI family protein [Nakamurella leprariae]
MSEPLRIVHLLFPDLTALDLAGPAQVFSHLPGVEQSFAWHRIESIPTDAGFAVLPTTTFTEASPADVVFVPGGEGAFALLEDEVALDFLRRQAVGATLVTSVCTGSFVLAGAGLLTGRRATTHWAWFDLLPLLGVVPVRERVVRDGTVITGAGVTSGIDFALTVTAQLAGVDVARGRQLTLEYAPQPPFDAGGPDRPDADPRQVAAARVAMAARWGPAVTRAAQRLRLP